MEVSELLDHTRSHVLRDVPAPQLFGDAAMLAYLNEGYKIFARTTHCFVTMNQLELESGENTYALPDGTVHVRQVMNDKGRFLAPFTRRAKPKQFVGRPGAYSTDNRHRQIRFWPTPDADYTYIIEYAHLPEQVEDGDEIDLDYDHALLLAQWIAYRCLMNNDPDGSETISADTFHAAWLVGLRDAKMDYTRMAMGDNPSAQPRSWT